MFYLNPYSNIFIRIIFYLIPFYLKPETNISIWILLLIFLSISILLLIFDLNHFDLNQRYQKKNIANWKQRQFFNNICIYIFWYFVKKTSRRFACKNHQNIKSKWRFKNNVLLKLFFFFRISYLLISNYTLYLTFTKYIYKCFKIKE